MSAYMVDREHIIYLVKAAVSRRLSEFDGGSIRWDHNGHVFQLRCVDDVEKLVRTAQMLWDANIRSINARYPDTVDNPKNMPGPCNETWRIEPKDFQRYTWMHFDIAQVAKAAHCFEYQSCEFPEWPESEAHAFIAALKEKCLHVIPGYSDAEWGAPKKNVR